MSYEAEQVSLFDQDTWCGKTCPEHSAAEAQKEQTSRRSLRRLSKSASRMPLFVSCHRVTDGQSPAHIMLTMDDGALHGACMTPSFGAFRSDENGLLWLQTSTEEPQQTYCLTLNCSEKPREEIKTRLSEVLEEHPDKKYDLSAKACQGILNRAERRGKELPVQLKEALERRAMESIEAEAIPVEFKILE